MLMRTAGLLLIVAGIAAVLVGAAAYLGWMSWFGSLPGDIHIGRWGLEIFVPITSMLIVSLVATLAFQLFRRLF